MKSLLTKCKTCYSRGIKQAKYPHLFEPKNKKICYKAGKFITKIKLLINN